MVTQLVVNYNFRSTKVKCEPSTALREVRKKACEVFGLKNEADFSLK